MSLILHVLTPEKTLFEGTSESIQFPGKDGVFQILKNHAPLMASLTQGNIIVNTGQNNQNISIEGGIVEVSNNKVTVLAR
tara:strand:+ start:826 stop:1065 length:240 start_codon:yes stop_codon:yes gene_type:complete